MPGPSLVGSSCYGSDDAIKPEAVPSHEADAASSVRGRLNRLVTTFDDGTPAGNLVKAIYAEDVSICSRILDEQPALINTNVRHYPYDDPPLDCPWLDYSNLPRSEPPLILASMLPRYKQQNGPSLEVFRIVQLFLERGADLTVPEHVGRPSWADSSLHRVCWEYDSVLMLDLLVRAGADPQIRLLDDHRQSVLQIAAGKGRVDSVRFLLRHGVKVVDHDLYGEPTTTTETPVHSAAECGQDEVLGILFEHGGTAYLNSERSDGFTPLQLALGMADMSHPVPAQRQEATVSMLIDAGAVITISRPDGVSTLRTAVVWAGPGVIRRLVEVGADAREIGSYSSQRHYWRSGSWVIAEREMVTNLHIAALNWNADGFSALINLGIEVNACDSDGQSPLHWVAISDLIDRGIINYDWWYLDANLQGELESSFNTAVRAASVLLEQGAIVDGQDQFGRSALHYAARSKCIPLVKLLLERGASLCLKDKDSSTPLHMLVDLPVVVLDAFLRQNIDEHLYSLISQASSTDSHIDVDYIDNLGDTPLHTAARCASDTGVDLCLRLGADPNRRNSNGSTPLHLAATRPYWQELHESQALWRPFSEGDRRATRIRELLLAAGADASLTNAAGHTAAEIELAEAKRIRIARELMEENERRPPPETWLIGLGRGRGSGRAVYYPFSPYD